MIENSIYNLRKIELILGTACNLNCLYCVQHENKPRCKKQIKPELLAWLDDIAYRLPMKFKPTIHFYGGEPLLYKEAIHQVIDHCGDDFNYLVVTNGTHLTDEDVEYFNKHKVRVALSNDGPNTKITRQVDMLEDEAFVARFNRLESREVDAVFSGLNQDFYGLFEHVGSKSPDTPVSNEDLICNTQTDERLATFDIPELLKCYKRMGDDLLEDWTKEGNTRPASHTFNTWVKHVVRCLNNPTFPSFASCGSGKSRLAVDTQGNVYLCKNFNVKIGTIADDYEVLNENAKKLTKELRDANLEGKGCFECPAFYFCRGGCPFEKPSELQKKKCDALRAKWASVVSFVDNKTQLEVK